MSCGEMRGSSNDVMLSQCEMRREWIESKKYRDKCRYLSCRRLLQDTVNDIRISRSSCTLEAFKIFVKRLTELNCLHRRG